MSTDQNQTTKSDPSLTDPYTVEGVPLTMRQRAILALDEAPDVDPKTATRAEVAAIHAANLKAWIILNGDRDPDSRRKSSP